MDKEKWRVFLSIREVKVDWPTGVAIAVPSSTFLVMFFRAVKKPSLGSGRFIMWSELNGKLKEFMDIPKCRAERKFLSQEIKSAFEKVELIVAPIQADIKEIKKDLRNLNDSKSSHCNPTDRSSDS